MARAAAPRGTDGDPLAALEKAPLRPYYLLHGDEPFLVDRALAVLRGRFLPAGRPGTWRVLWADDAGDRIGAALDDLASPSLFGGTQVLVVRRAEALRGEGEERMLAALPAVGAGGGLVLVAESADQRRKVLAACVRAGAAFDLSRPTKPWEVARWAAPWAVRLARERGHEIASPATEELVARVGADLGTLAGEIEKLSIHAGAGVRIEPSHVDAVVGGTRGHQKEQLGDLLAAGDAAGAVRAVHQLLDDGEPAILLVAFLASSLRRALQAAELGEEGLSHAEIAARLKVHEFVLRKIRGRARAVDLLHALFVLRRLDVELKSGRPERAVVDAALLELRLGAQAPARAPS